MADQLSDFGSLPKNSQKGLGECEVWIILQPIRLHPLAVGLDRPDLNLLDHTVRTGTTRSRTTVNKVPTWALGFIAAWKFDYLVVLDWRSKYIVDKARCRFDEALRIRWAAIDDLAKEFIKIFSLSRRAHLCLEQYGAIRRHEVF